MKSAFDRASTGRLGQSPDAPRDYLPALKSHRDRSSCASAWETGWGRHLRDLNGFTLLLNLTPAQVQAPESTTTTVRHHNLIRTRRPLMHDHSEGHVCCIIPTWLDVPGIILYKQHDEVSSQAHLNHSHRLNMSCFMYFHSQIRILSGLLQYFCIDCCINRMQRIAHLLFLVRDRGIERRAKLQNVLLITICRWSIG